MTKHDTRVHLIPNSPIKGYLHLFPHGIPMRDPFGMERAIDESGRIMVFWIVDLDRLNQQQFEVLAQAIASSFNVEVQAVAVEAIAKGGFAINNEWVASMECGAEGMQRIKELTEFLETSPQSPILKAWSEFISDQRRRWIDGDEVPPPMPTIMEEFFPRLVTPELEAALKAQQVEKALSQYFVLDVLTGRVITEILNELDSDSEYSVADRDYDEEDF